MMLGTVALVAACLGSVVGVIAALKWGPSRSVVTAAAPPPASPVTPPTTAAAATTTSTSPSTSTIPSPPPEAAPASNALAFTDATADEDGAQWFLQLDPDQPETEGLTIRGSGAGTNYPLLMVRDFRNAPIAWIAPHGGLSVTDNIRVKSGVFEDDGVSMRRWTDTVAATGPGGFSWDGRDLVQTTVGEAGSAQPLPDAPELWLRIIDNTGEEPRYLVVPAFLEE